MSPDGLDRDDVTHALDALASEVPAPTADAPSLIARGRRRLMKQRVAITVAVLAVIATAASVGAVVSNNNDTPRVVAPTTSTTPSKLGFGEAKQIAVASSLEAWKCLDPLQYTDNGGRTWRTVSYPDHGLNQPTSCTATEGGNMWAVLSSADGAHYDVLRVRHGTDVDVVRLAQVHGGDYIQDAPYFADADHGWIESTNESGPSQLYGTTDGGTTWKLVSLRKYENLVAFTNTHTGPFFVLDQLSVAPNGDATPKPITWPSDIRDASRIVFRGNSIIVWKSSPKRDGPYRTVVEVNTDRGATWVGRAGPVVTGGSSTAFDAADAFHWFVISDGKLSVSADAGKTWQTRSVVPGVIDVREMVFPTTNVGWIVSGAGTILRTTDAGRTWTGVTNGGTPQTPPPAVTQAQPIPMVFVSPTEGWLCSDPLRFTADAGTTWRNVGYSTSPPTAPSYQQPLCAATPGGDAWVLTAAPDPQVQQLLHFRRGGESRDDPLPFPRLPDATRIVELTFADANHGWAISEPTVDGPTLDLYRTTDGGRTWSIVSHNPPLGLTFTSATDGWGAGGRHTADGGHTWVTADAPTPDLPQGFLVGLGDTVVTPDAIVVRGSSTAGNIASLFFDVSTDGGSTWTMHTGPPPHEIIGTTEPQEFDAVDAHHWQLSASNALYTTADSGDTWTQVADFAGVENITSVAFLTPEIGFVSVTGNPPNDFATAVLETSDGGDSWTNVDQQAPAEPPGGLASFPGGIIGCPTRPLTPGPPTFEIAQRAADYAHVARYYVRNVYSGSSTQGEFARVFRFNVGSCGPNILENSYVAYVIGPPNAGPGGSTARVTLALAHYADGWHVFGRYP